MTIHKTAFVLVFGLLFSIGQPALAARSEVATNRYFVKSAAGLWKNSLGVRHVFKGGFTSDMSDWQLRVAKIFGVDVEPVTKLFVLEPEAVAADIAASTPGKKSEGRFVPDAAVPWGVRMMYNDTEVVPEGGQGITVAVLDTGVLKTHPDIARRVAGCKDFSSPRSPMVDGKCDDRNGHGTHVAGTIAADGGKDNLGIYGVAPQASLFAYKVCGNDGSCWADDVAAAIRTAADERAQVVNLSLGSDKPSPLMEEAIAYAVAKDVLVVAAAGNDGPYDGSIDYPAAYADVVAVGAVGSTRAVPDWSSRGINDTTTPGVIELQDMEFAAPGVTIESTWKDGGYAVLSGTSMATPHISGLAAKLWNSDLTHPAAEVRSVLVKISRDILPEGEDNASGYGIPVVQQ
ncbi:MAG: S8 family peptidase [Patescibacteria group bacterium]